ncbi:MULTISPECIES: DUF6527 family protein [Rhizobium/Agrobacterium group]|uniref:Ammonia monooxygenase n=1 Tax=Agrobacterium vitis TaxID=373 RepID=A0ABD6H559_AGRVI|nr:MULTISPECIES: DUF6527 family protein [Rhizobium/Agrobacterium group]MUO27414.1 ammonia monooxygenase [Agrobacterium vitis]MUO42136.1 ammonia monooxygenase [Agrobacterium vitis]MUP09444.1 ammonia monooxygenase [Agrobacterium vitis]
MAAISKKLRSIEGGRLGFMCPGCNGLHQVAVGHGPGPRWQWNGDKDRPTFSPSILVTWKEPSDNPDEFDDETKDIPKVCHSFVGSGKIQFLGDCTHALVGQTVEIPDLPARGEE